MTSIFGLPAHPLFAHIPVVLIPLGTIGAVLMLWSKLRDKIGWFVVGIVLVAGIATQFAVSSGHSLKDYVHETQLVRDHTHMGENLRPWVLLMFLALLGVMLVTHLTRRRTADARTNDSEATTPAGKRDLLRVTGIVCAVLSILFSVMATYWTYKIGHSGSKAVWAPTQAKIDKGVREHGGERNAGTGG